jgi:uncharacterized protein (DUF433 family)
MMQLLSFSCQNMSRAYHLKADMLSVIMSPHSNKGRLRLRPEMAKFGKRDKSAKSELNRGRMGYSYRLAMKHAKRSERDVAEMPNYSLAEAARYFHIPFSTVEYWTAGTCPIVKLASSKPRMLSFKNLVEFYVLEGLRHIHGLKLGAIRDAVDDLLEHENSEHPLADFELQTLNRRYLVFSREGTVLNASLHGQYEIPDWTAPYLKRVDRDVHGRAQKIHPFMKRSQIQADAEPPQIVVIDPNVCFGLPVLRGSRITTGFIASRNRGGDSVSAIARSYGRPVAEVKEAIEWETGRPVKELPEQSDVLPG